MDVSVIVLCYNQEDTISRTLDSILSQETSCDFEIIIGDDFSKDKTRYICLDYQKKYPDSIRVIPEHENFGVLKNYATCVSCCRGKYCMVCAGDDWWSNSSKIQRQFDFMEQHQEFVMCYSGYDEYYPATGKKISYLPVEMPKPLFLSLLNSIPICAPTVCIRKEALDKIDFDEFIRRGFWCEDYPMYLALSLQGEFGIIMDSLVTYTVQSGSLDHFRSYERKMTQIDNDDNIRRYFIESNSYQELYGDLIKDVSCRLRSATAVSYNNRKDALKWIKAIKRKTLKDYMKLLICSFRFLFNRYHERLSNITNIE